VQLEDKPAATDRAGHEISDDYERETSVIEQVLAAAVKRRREKSRRQGERHYGEQVSQLMSMSFYEFLLVVPLILTFTV